MKITYKQYRALLVFDKNYARNNPKSVDYFYQFTTQQIPKWKYRNIDKYLYNLMYGGLYTDIPIYYIAQKFSEAAIKNEDKLRKLCQDVEIRKEVAENCAMIYANMILAMKNGVFTVFAKGGEILALIDENNEISYLGKDMPEHDLSLSRFAYIFFSFLIFKKYASVDLVFVEKGKKKKTSIADNGKIVNDTGVDVILLDSTWFREIIRNEGFKVRGHFRLQPYKDENGKWTRKLIYINEFEKHGYHRRAKIAVERETIEQALS